MSRSDSTSTYWVHTGFLSGDCQARIATGRLGRTTHLLWALLRGVGRQPDDEEMPQTIIVEWKFPAVSTTRLKRLGHFGYNITNTKIDIVNYVVTFLVTFMEYVR